jgi:hypothetical protein
VLNPYISRSEPARPIVDGLLMDVEPVPGTIFDLGDGRPALPAHPGAVVQNQL